MTGIIVNWTGLLRRHLWPHLFMGMMTVFFGLSINGSPAINLSLQPLRTNHPDENVRFQQLISLSKQPSRRLLTSGVSYWQQYSVRLAIKRLAFIDLMQAESVQPNLTRQTLLFLTELQSNLLIALALPKLIRPMLVSALMVYLGQPLAAFPKNMHWLAVVKGIRAGPVSV